MGGGDDSVSGRVLKDTIFGEGGKMMKKLAIVLVLLLVVSLILGSIGCAEEEEEVPLQAGFTASPTLGKAPLQVQFTDQSTGDITSREWDFDSDGTVDSTAKDPSHTYDTAGTYTVSLTVTAADGSEDTETKVGYVRVGDLLAGFSASRTSGIVPLAVEFTDQSVGAITSWAWDFGDGGTSTEQSPSHTYNTVGVYTVSLTVTAAEGTDTYSEVTIQVQAVPELEQQTWKLSHGFPETGVRGKVAIKFAELMEEATDGKITIDIFPNGTLFSSSLARQAVIDGSVDMTFDPPYYWGVNLPWIPWLYMWGLFSTYEHALGVWSSQEWTAAMDPIFEDLGVKYLCMTPESMYSMYITNKEAVTDFTDMAGWKEAAYAGSSPTAGALAIGFDRVTIPWGQEQTALIAGTIDVYSASVTTGVGQQIWTFVDYAIAGSLATGSMAVVNEDTWNALPAYWQNVIMTEVVPQTIQWAYEEGNATETAEMAILEDNLVEFNVMTVEQMANFRAAEMELDEVKAQMYDAGELIVGLILDWEP